MTMSIDDWLYTANLLPLDGQKVYFQAAASPLEGLRGTFRAEGLLGLDPERGESQETPKWAFEEEGNGMQLHHSVVRWRPR